MHLLRSATCVGALLCSLAFASELLAYDKLKTLEPEERVRLYEEGSKADKFAFWASKFQDSLKNHDGAPDDKKAKALKQGIQFFETQDHEMESTMKKNILDSFGVKEGTALLRVEGVPDEKALQGPLATRQGAADTCSCTITVPEFCAHAGFPDLVCTINNVNCAPVDKCVDFGDGTFAYCDGHCVPR